MDRLRHGGNSAFERRYGCCRAIRAGAHIFVSGTTAQDADLDGDTRTQFLSALARIEAALHALGASLADVVRTVIYVRDIADVDAIAAVHARAFGANSPASTLVEVSGLTPAEARVEIEVTVMADIS